MIAFGDTSAFFALLDVSDKAHLRAAAGWSQLLGIGATVITSNYVLTETTALLQRRLGLAAVRDFYQTILPQLRVEWITDDVHELGVQALLTANRRDLSLVDCTSFVLMNRLGVRTAFCFDAHFDEQGFVTTIPGRVN